MSIYKKALIFLLVTGIVGNASYRAGKSKARDKREDLRQNLAEVKVEREKERERRKKSERALKKSRHESGGGEALEHLRQERDALQTRLNYYLTALGNEKKIEKRIKEERRTIFFENDKPFRWGHRDYSCWKVLTECALPDPAKAPYTDCLLVIEAQEVDLAVSSEADAGKSRVVRMVLPGFADRRPKTGMILRKGDLFQCQIFSPDELPESLLSTQTVDSTERFDFDTFVAMTIHRCEGLPERYAPPSDFAANAKLSREQAIRRDREKFQNWLAEHGGSLEALIEEKAALLPEIRSRLEKAGGILNQDRMSFTQVPEGSGVSDGWEKQPLAVIRSFHEQMQARGIDLIVCPIPEKELIVSPAFFNEPIIDAQRYRIYQKLWQEGIEIIDLLPTIHERADEFRWMMYNGRDQHPADGVIRIAADRIAERLCRYDFVESGERNCLQVPLSFGLRDEDKDFPDSAYLPNAYSATRVLRANGQPVSMFDPPPRNSPVLLAGDSFTMVPFFYGVDGGDVLAQLTLRTGVEALRLYVGGGGPAMLKQLAARPESLKGKKLVIFCFAERYLFKSSKWSDVKVPVTAGG